MLAEAPVHPPDQSERDPNALSRHPFIEWCTERYVNLDHGSAYLIAVHNCRWHVDRLTKRFPMVTRVDLWSGVLAWRDLQEENARRIRAKSRSDGIVLGAPPAWEVAAPKNTTLFLRTLPSSFSSDCVLYLEGYPDDRLREYLEQRPATNTTEVAKGTVWPRPQIFHMPTTPENIEGLALVVENLHPSDIADHLHVYRGNEVLLQCYDFFAGCPILLSRSLPEDKIRSFCEALQTTYTVES